MPWGRILAKEYAFNTAYRSYLTWLRWLRGHEQGGILAKADNSTDYSPNPPKEKTTFIGSGLFPARPSGEIHYVSVFPMLEMKESTIYRALAETKSQFYIFTTILNYY